MNREIADDNYYPGFIRFDRWKRRNPKTGEVFRMNLIDGRFLFGRVIESPAVRGFAALIYVYRVVSSPENPESVRELLTPDNILLPPTYADITLYKSRLAAKMAVWSLTADDRLNPECFLKSESSRYGFPMYQEYSPSEGSWHLADRSLEAADIVDADHRPVADPKPPYGRLSSFPNAAGIAEQVRLTLDAFATQGRLLYWPEDAAAWVPPVVPDVLEDDGDDDNTDAGWSGDPFRLIDDDPDGAQLVFDTGDLPTDSAVVEQGHTPNGEFWAGVAKYLVAKSAPQLVDELAYDPEAGMFAAYGSVAALTELMELMRSAVTDPTTVTTVIQAATAAGFEFDD